MLRARRAVPTLRKAAAATLLLWVIGATSPALADTEEVPAPRIVHSDANGHTMPGGEYALYDTAPGRGVEPIAEYTGVPDKNSPRVKPIDAYTEYAVDTPVDVGKHYWIVETRSPDEQRALIRTPLEFVVKGPADFVPLVDGEEVYITCDPRTTDTCDSALAKKETPDGIFSIEGSYVTIHDPRAATIPRAGGIGVWAVAAGAGILILGGLAAAFRLTPARNKAAVATAHRPAVQAAIEAEAPAAVPAELHVAAAPTLAAAGAVHAPESDSYLAGDNASDSYASDSYAGNGYLGDNYVGDGHADDDYADGDYVDGGDLRDYYDTVATQSEVHGEYSGEEGDWDTGHDAMRPDAVRRDAEELVAEGEYESTYETYETYAAEHPLEYAQEHADEYAHEYESHGVAFDAAHDAAHTMVGDEHSYEYDESNVTSGAITEFDDTELEEILAEPFFEDPHTAPHPDAEPVSGRPEPLVARVMPMPKRGTPHINDIPVPTLGEDNSVDEEFTLDIFNPDRAVPAESYEAASPVAEPAAGEAFDADREAASDATRQEAAWQEADGQEAGRQETEWQEADWQEATWMSATMPEGYVPDNKSDSQPDRTSGSAADALSPDALSPDALLADALVTDDVDFDNIFTIDGFAGNSAIPEAFVYDGPQLPPSNLVSASPWADEDFDIVAFFQSARANHQPQSAAPQLPEEASTAQATAAGMTAKAVRDQATPATPEETTPTRVPNAVPVAVPQPENVSGPKVNTATANASMATASTANAFMANADMASAPTVRYAAPAHYPGNAQQPSTAAETQHHEVARAANETRRGENPEQGENPDQGKISRQVGSPRRGNIPSNGSNEVASPMPPRMQTRAQTRSNHHAARYAIEAIRAAHATQASQSVNPRPGTGA